MENKKHTTKFKDILFYKGYFIVVYDNGGYSVAQNVFCTSATGCNGMKHVINYINGKYDASGTEREILSIEKEIKSKQNKIKELKNTLDNQRENLKELTNE